MMKTKKGIAVGFSNGVSIVVGEKMNNGATVLDVHPQLVLAMWTKDSRPEYITWELNSEEGYAFSGHYFTSLKQAMEDFEIRRLAIDDKVFMSCPGKIIME